MQTIATVAVEFYAHEAVQFLCSKNTYRKKCRNFISVSHVLEQLFFAIKSAIVIFVHEEGSWLLSHLIFFGLPHILTGKSVLAGLPCEHSLLSASSVWSCLFFFFLSG